MDDDILLQEVALRKESVDRNKPNAKLYYLPVLSLSARRAWIEMRGTFIMSVQAGGRSPQGERG